MNNETLLMILKEREAGRGGGTEKLFEGIRVTEGRCRILGGKRNDLEYLSSVYQQKDVELLTLI